MPTSNEYRSDGGDPRCAGCVHAELMFCNHPDEVGSRQTVIFQFEARGEDDPCGPDGVLYEKDFMFALQEILDA